jgi:hypothetical protein
MEWTLEIVLGADMLTPARLQNLRSLDQGLLVPEALMLYDALLQNLLRIASQAVIVVSMVRDVGIVNYLATLMTSFVCNVTGVEGQTDWMILLTVSSRETVVDLGYTYCTPQIVGVTLG